jgi:hypothetical protein
MSPLPTTDAQRATPVACSLDAGNLRTQAQRWVELVGTAGIDRAAAAADGVTLRFRADPAVERELRELVAVERGCCSWARWEVSADGDGALVMHAGTTGDGVATLQSMFRAAPRWV